MTFKGCSSLKVVTKALGGKIVLKMKVFYVVSRDKQCFLIFFKNNSFLLRSSFFFFDRVLPTLRSFVGVARNSKFQFLK